MDSRTREQLRIIVSVALALVPRAIRRDYGVEKITSKADPAKAAITERVLDAVDQHFRVEEKTGCNPDYRGW